MIEKIIPGTRTRLRILAAIYENPGINLASLIKKSKTSPNIVLKYANELRDFKVICEEITKGKQKVHLRKISPNLRNEIGREVFSLIEINKKFLFLGKYKWLANPFEQLSEIGDIKFILVYGSFARFAATKESDLDILIVGSPSKEDINRIREIFVALRNEPSIKIETLPQFKNNLGKPLYINIVKEHIILHGQNEFLGCI